MNHEFKQMSVHELAAIRGGGDADDYANGKVLPKPNVTEGDPDDFG